MDALADLANLLKDPQNPIMVGTIIETDLADDRSVLRASVNIWPDNKEMIARVAWDSVGPNAGIFQFPQAGDLVIVELVDDNEDSAMITKRLSSKVDTIPVTATDGSTVIRSLSGKKLWNTSDLRINLSRGDTEPAENLVIGQVFKTTYLRHLTDLIDLIDKLITQRQSDSDHTHLNFMGIPGFNPIQSAVMLSEKADLATIKAEVEALKTDDVQSENILSDIAFTEK